MLRLSQWLGSMAIALLAANHASAQEPVEGAPLTETFDRIWNTAIVTGDPSKDEFPFIKFRGRYHFQTYFTDSDDSTKSDWENRRIRLGLDIMLSKKAEIEFDMNMRRGGGGPLADDFDTLQLNYAFTKDTTVSIGKLRRAPLTREDSISSNKILTIERSILTARYFLDNSGGVYVQHTEGDWTFGGGLLTGTSEENDLNLPTFDGSMLFQGNVAKQISPITEVRLDYLHNPGDPENTTVEPFEHVVSLNSATELDRWGVFTDLIYAQGLDEARGDLFGVVVLPYYMLTHRWQLVGRYSYTSSPSDDGIRLLSRYERPAVPSGNQFGDRHEAWYAGLNYYFYGHRLKAISGIEYTNFDGVDGKESILTGTVGFRLYF